MSNTEKPIPDDEWNIIVANVPLVSVDFVIEHDGCILLAKRENEPGKYEWFVPARTVFKNESRTDAVHRVGEEELSQGAVIDDCLETYEHCYETAATDGVKPKHYLATGYRCHFDPGDPEICGDGQHSAFQIFRPPSDDLQPYVEQYLHDQ
jgi:colanic acid biosynthesis protein WcaH